MIPGEWGYYHDSKEEDFRPTEPNKSGCVLFFGITLFIFVFWALWIR